MSIDVSKQLSNNNFRSSVFVLSTKLCRRGHIISMPFTLDLAAHPAPCRAVPGPV